MEPEFSKPSGASKVKQRLREKASQLEDLLSKIDLDDRQEQERPRPKKVAAPKVASSTAPKQTGVAKAAATQRAAPQPKAEPLRQPPEGPPARKFEVLLPEVAVHKWPEEASVVVGWKRRGDRVEAAEETFDGWARLVDGEGWVRRERQLPDRPARCLEPIGAGGLELVAPLVAKEPGRLMFEVVGSPEVPVYAQPIRGAATAGAKAVGEIVLAETQSYHGWLRLSGGVGWLPAASPRRGELVCCLHAEEEAARSARQERIAEERAQRAAAEADLELELERARQSDIWRQLQEPAKPVDIRRCDRLSLRPGDSAPVVKTASSLPLQKFRVLPEDGAVVRLKPNSEASVCGIKREGDLVLAGEETFNGWVKLADGPGWILRDLAGEGSAGLVLSSIGGAQDLLVPELARVPGRQLFEVDAAPSCDAQFALPVLREPEEGALVLGTRSVGEVVLAETQSYHGWVKLSDEEGWMEGRPSLAGSCCWLRCMREDELQLCKRVGADGSGSEAAADEAEAVAAAEAAQREEALRRESLQHLEDAAQNGNTAQFCSALEMARQRGVAKADIARANALRRAA